MNKEDAIRILTDELKHTEFHLQDKNKAPEFYEEMRDYCEAARMAIKVLKIFDDVKQKDLKKNYIDEKGNYHNIQNFTLAQIYDSGVEEGYRIARMEASGEYEQRNE